MYENEQKNFIIGKIREIQEYINNIEDIPINNNNTNHYSDIEEKLSKIIEILEDDLNRSEN